MTDLSPADCDLWVDPAGLPCLTEPVSGEAPLDAIVAVSSASTILWALSGRVWGPTCASTVRPCHRSWCEVPHRFGLRRYGAARPWPCGRLGPDLDLQPLGPVHDLSVVVDGEPFLAWRLDEGRLLRRTDGRSWPTYQDLDLDLDQPDTWGVTYRSGRPLDTAARRAVEIYACELLKARRGETGCRLPRRTRQVVRQSVTIDLIDPMEYIDAGRTGIPEVDMWLRAVNPHGLDQPSRAINVDRRPPRATGFGPVTS